MRECEPAQTVLSESKLNFAFSEQWDRQKDLEIAKFQLKIGFEAISQRISRTLSFQNW